MNEKLVSIGDNDVTLRVDRDGDTFHVANGESSLSLRVVGRTERWIEIEHDGRRINVPYVTRNGAIEFVLDGETWRAEVSEGARRKRHRREHSMSAPMPGVVLKIFVEPGAIVTKGEPLLILEAMKMEHQIAAPYDGTVRSIDCTVGELVQPGVDLIQLDKKESE